MSWNCLVGAPEDADLITLRKLPWGLGQPTTGEYDMAAGGWKTFGGQGQYPNTETPLGWTPAMAETCRARYLMVVVVNKEGAEWFENSKNLILDIKVVNRGDSAIRDKVGLFSKILLSAFIFKYFI